MVVDDEPDVGATFKIGLERDGFAVDVFTDPKAALEQFKPDYYSMVLADIRMPDMNGFQLYRELKKKDEKIKIAFITAFEMYASEFRKVMPDMNVKCFIRKPVSMSDLARLVKEELSEDKLSAQ